MYRVRSLHLFRLPISFAPRIENIHENMTNIFLLMAPKAGRAGYALARLTALICVLFAVACSDPSSRIVGNYSGTTVLSPKMVSMLQAGGPKEQRALAGLQSAKWTLDLDAGKTFVLGETSSNGNSTVNGTWSLTGEEVILQGGSISVNGGAPRSLAGGTPSKLRAGGDDRLTMENTDPQASENMTTTFTKSTR
jgi:hypothetical protein